MFDITPQLPDSLVTCGYLCLIHDPTSECAPLASLDHLVQKHVGGHILLPQGSVISELKFIPVVLQMSDHTPLFFSNVIVNPGRLHRPPLNLGNSEHHVPSAFSAFFNSMIIRLDQDTARRASRYKCPVTWRATVYSGGQRHENIAMAFLFIMRGARDNLWRGTRL